MNSENTINKLIEILPEVYQPIFGHPDLNIKHSRPCEDRLTHISEVCVSLKKTLNRRIRILDLGCAQGFFSLSLAQKTNSFVYGIDFQKENIDVCNQLASENTSLNVIFEKGRIEHIIEEINTGEYDLVLCLSVLHHLIHEKGYKYTHSLLNVLSNKVNAIVCELAVYEEPLYWAKSLPKEPIDLLSSLSFVHEIGIIKTHLSEIKRPMYFASNKYWYLGGISGDFKRIETKSHNLSKNRTRKYYFNKDNLVKIFERDSKNINYDEIKREVLFLQKPPSNMKTPTILTHGENEKLVWLAREKIPGYLLADHIKKINGIDTTKIALEILRQLIKLEKNNLYHNDVRLWNIIIGTENNPILIDYGSISEIPNDCAWPYNNFLSFFIFLNELYNKEFYDRGDIKLAWISPFNLPYPINKKLTSIWQKPLHEWSFELIYNTLNTNSNAIDNTYLEQTPIILWMKAMEQLATSNSKEIDEAKRLANRANKRIDIIIKPFKKTKTLIKKLLQTINYKNT